ncbi:cytochrome P450 [Nocardioides sp. MAH-18]|uniref:Cytochrome P450 n=1 Tax=Nocardioides agri TaxID=2682843 RepID=A0A6L6XV44_9ACTN|nr:MULTISPECIES: cytochrome P450 [unclassified Nocardioides]MBA2955506.1 cytochrome P450 [Nocardioides sp. CGMCC 1.13656]MVQ50356.1 cytochrome P450 [Nocardioides sp. MAH-18]
MSTPIVFDPYDYAFQEDPYPTYRRCRDEDPLHHNEDLDIWFLTRHADIQHALRVEGTYSNAMGVSIDKSAWGPDAHRVMSFLGMDPPRQKRLRSLVSKGFTPRRVTELAPRIRELTDHYLDQCLEMGSFDWIHDFAGKLPMDVISEMMGVPEADRTEIRRLADLVVHREPGVRDVPREGMEASLTLVVYYAEMVEERKKRPTADLTSALLTAEIDGDRLTDEEIIAFLFLMVVAGNETTTKLLGHALFHLSRHPEQHEKVFADPADPDGLVSPWIEETLRYDTSSQMLARHLLEDVELHGKVAPAGAKAVLVLGSANRDDRVFADPDRYDVFRDKDELGQLLSFGGGRHFCLGANLARLEAQIALGELVRRVKAIDVAHDDCRRVHSVNVRGFASVPVRMEVR